MLVFWKVVLSSRRTPGPVSATLPFLTANILPRLGRRWSSDHRAKRRQLPLIGGPEVHGSPGSAGPKPSQRPLGWMVIVGAEGRKEGAEVGTTMGRPHSTPRLPRCPLNRHVGSAHREHQASAQFDQESFALLPGLPAHLSRPSLHSKPLRP